MNSRRKTLPLGVDCNGLEMSRNGTPLRQMSITESFKYTKPKAFKMDRRFDVSSVCMKIDSDSDDENPPQFEGIRPNLEHDDSEASDLNRTMGTPSPPKRLRASTANNKPSASTPKTSSKDKNVFSMTSPSSFISLSTPGRRCLNLSTDSPRSDCSNRTIIYDYGANKSNCWDEATVPFSPNSMANQDNTSETLLMNYEETALDPFSLQENNNEFSPSRPENIIKNSTVVKRLDFNNTTDNNNATSKKEQKKRKPRKDKNSTSNKQDQKYSTIITATDITNTTPKKQIKRKLTKSKNNNQEINSTVKENSSPNQNLTSSPNKAVIQSVHFLSVPTTGQNSAQITKSLVNQSSRQTILYPATTEKSSENTVTHGEGSGHERFLVLNAETIRKRDVTDNVTKKKKNLSAIIDKIQTNKGISITPVQLKNNCNTSPNPDQKNIDTPAEKAIQSSLAATGWTGKMTNRSSAIPRKDVSNVKKARVKAQNTNSSNQTFVKSNHSQTRPSEVAKPQNNSGSKLLTVQENINTSDKVIPPGLEKTLQKKSQKKVVNDGQQPCCSKSLVNENSQVKQNMSSAKQDATINKETNASASKGNCTTSEKQKMGPNTPHKSPRKQLFGSPSKGSPTKNREIKNLKGKEGKELQVRQMDELVKLFQVVAKNRHLRALLNNYEHGILKKFINMEDNKRYVVMKLFTFQRLWYNWFNFCTKAKLDVDDKDIIDIFEYLREEEFVDAVFHSMERRPDYKTSANLSELIDRLDHVKVKEIMVELKIRPIRGKKENVKTIIAAASQQRTLTYSRTFKDIIMDNVEKKMGFAVRIKEHVFNTFYNVYLLATFTNPDFYKVDEYFRNIIHLRVVFPEISVEEYLVFYSRDKFRNYGQALKMRTELDEQLISKNRETKFIGIYNIGEEAYGQLFSLDAEDTDDHGEAPHLKRFTAQHVYCGILSTCCDHIFTKQNGRPNEVKKWLEYLIKKFPSSRRLGKWYHKLIWLHMRHLDDINYELAATRLIEAFDKKKLVLGEIAKYELGALGQPLKSSKKHKIDQLYHDRVAKIIPRPIDAEEFPQLQIDSQCIRSEELGKKRAYIKKNDQGMTVGGVEEVALEYYAGNGYPGGEHCEGSLIKALLMLFFWDIIYYPTKPIPGTFISTLQTAPLDMFTPYFYENRKELIDNRLEEIGSRWSEEKLIHFAAENWQRHAHEKATFGMILNVIKEEVTVEVLITVIGRRVLKKTFKRLIRNIREFSSGMPDLLVWNIDERKCKFVEVKGEGDRLSTGQKLWLRYLKEIGAPIEVCFVHSTGSKRKKIKKVSTESGEQCRVPSEVNEDNDAGPSCRPDD